MLPSRQEASSRGPCIHRMAGHWGLNAEQALRNQHFVKKVGCLTMATQKIDKQKCIIFLYPLVAEPPAPPSLPALPALARDQPAAAQEGLAA